MLTEKRETEKWSLMESISLPLPVLIPGALQGSFFCRSFSCQHPGSGILCILSRTLLPVFPTGKESRSGPGRVGFCAATPRQVDGSQRPSGVVRQEENVVAVVSPCDCLYGLLKQAVILADLFKQFGQQR